MNRIPLPGLILAAAILVLPRAAALDADKWSKVDNRTNLTYSLTVSDTLGAQGSLYIRAAGATGDGKELTSKNDTFAMGPGKWEYYFRTNAAGAIGIHLAIQENTSGRTIRLHVTNLDATIPGTELQISSKPLESCNILIDPSGYRNAAGGTLFTFVQPR